MKSQQISQRFPGQDRYPSRNGAPAHLIERTDPVVYAANTASGPLDQWQTEKYRRQGFIVLENVFEALEVRSLQAELERIRVTEKNTDSERVITEPDSGDVRSVFAVHQHSPVFSRLAQDQRLVAVARHILADEVYIHQSRVNYKPGFRGKPFYWHSDFETWHVEDGMPAMRALSISISLTDNYENNGPLMLIPGSHNSYVACEGTTPEQHFRTSLKQQRYGIPDDATLNELVDRGGISSVTTPPGSVVVFDSNTMHGSNGNITPFARSNVFIVYNAMCNRVQQPFSDHPPRPEYICTRANIAPLPGSAQGVQA